MVFILGICIITLLAFCGVLVYGAPYLPTLHTQAEIALELLNLQPGQTLLELGCGDGRVLILAAQHGLQAVGIELNPFLAALCWLRTRRYRKQVRIIWGNFWTVSWPEADGVFTFLLDRFMPRLDARMKVIGVPLASFAFKIPGRAAVTEREGVFLYRY